jgi:hypothetical protein
VKTCQNRCSESEGSSRDQPNPIRKDTARGIATWEKKPV